MREMNAVVIRQAGGPDVLKMERLPIPIPKHGEVQIRVRAFGLNRSELFTRQGHSPGVKFPRGGMNDQGGRERPPWVPWWELSWVWR